MGGLREQRAAVDGYGLTRDVAIADQHGNHLRDLVSSSRSPDGNPRGDAGGDQWLPHVSIDETGRDSVDRDPLGGESQRVATGEPLQSSLRRRVGDADGPGANTSADL